jgi:hypothetical protein
MKYTLSKIFTVLFCSVFIGIGLVFMISGVASGGREWYLAFAFGSFFAAIGSIVMVTRLRQIRKFETKTYAWYKSAYPENVQGNRVTCNDCGNGRINVRALMNRTFHREHVCTQCGKALYYSPE